MKFLKEDFMATNNEVGLLPNMSSQYHLTDDQIVEFRTNGHIALNKVADIHEVNVVRPIISEIVGSQEPFQRTNIREVTGLWRMDRTIERFVTSRRLARIVSQLMQVPAVHLFFDAALYKKPRDKHTQWHQDHSDWAFDTDNIITLWMPLVNLQLNMGTLTYFTGSHKLGRSTLKTAIQQNYAQTHYTSLEAGDAIFHNGWTWHSSTGNSSDVVREVLAIIFFPAGTKIRNHNDPYFFPGRQPGELAAGSGHPLLYSNQMEDNFG
jgi:ectoine hydroxylase-related dioxygenase (phytanoyl-CoA dioxygenase family)